MVICSMANRQGLLEGDQKIRDPLETDSYNFFFFLFFPLLSAIRLLPLPSPSSPSFHCLCALSLFSSHFLSQTVWSSPFAAFLSKVFFFLSFFSFQLPPSPSSSCNHGISSTASSVSFCSHPFCDAFTCCCCTTYHGSGRRWASWSAMDGPFPLWRRLLQRGHLLHCGPQGQTECDNWTAW